jgi:hypothetical protein
MSVASKRRFQITYPIILMSVLFLHASFMAFKGLPKLDLIFFKKDDRMVLNIRRVKAPRIENPITTTNLPVRNVKSGAAQPEIGKMQLNDLAIPSSVPEKMARPGTRPEPLAKKAITQISMKDNSFKDYAKSYPSGIADLSSVNIAGFKITDAAIGIENPDGVEPDELNQNELVYYGFQKRMLVGLINSVMKEAEKFSQKHRNYKIEANLKIQMTARLTYDSEGNVKQIKMIRWTHLNEIQGVFENSMKNLNRLNNPPKMLWSKSGEFNVFYTWIIST